MCFNCASNGIGRRDLMKLGAAAAIALAAGGAPPAARAADGAPTSLSPQEALAQLKAGNERYVSHPELCAVKRTVGRLTEASPLLAGVVGAGKLKIVAAIYDPQTGVATYLD
jgi:carbonic anhydrase